MSKRKDEMFYVYEKGNGGGWAPAPGLYGGHRWAFDAYRKVRGEGSALKVYKIARSAEGRAFRLIKGGIHE